MTRPNGGGLLRPQDLDIGSFFESMQDAVIVAEAFTGRIVLWNPVASVVFGYSPVEALGMNVEEFVPGRLKARHRGEMSAYRETGRSPYIDSGTVLDLPAVRKDGEEIHVELTLSTIEPVRDAGVQGQFMLAIVRDVTVHKRAEEEARRLSTELEQRVVEATAQLEAASAELRDSEERYRWLVESLRDYAIFIVEADGRIANWNVGAERIFGYREEEIIDKDFSILFTPEDTRQGVPERELRKAAAEGRAEDERWHVRKDGSRFWASGIVAPIRDETGNPRGFTKVARDLTERKLAAEALEESEERFRATFEQAAVGIAHVAPDGRWLRVNDKLCEIVGYPREELLEMSWKDIAHSEDVEADLEQIRRLMVGEIGTYSMEQRYFRQDGSIVWVKFTVSLVREPSGEPKYFIAVVEDVTERKRDHEQLAYHASLLENVRDAVLATDERFVLTAWNRGAEKMYGWKASEALGRHVWDVVRSELTDEQRAEALRDLSETRRFRAEVITYHKDGTPIHTEEITVALPGEAGRIAGYLSISRDITARKQVEETLRESSRRISNILESITDEFFAVDREWRFTYINERALRRIQREKGEQLTREELLGKNAWELYPELVGSVFYQKYHEALREQKTVELEAHSPLNDKWFEIHAYPSQQGLSVYYRDTTDRKRTQKEIETRTHQQAVVAELGRRALAETELSVLMDEAVALVAHTLEVEYCKVLELLPSGDKMLLRAGVGWEEGLVGNATVGAGLDSQARYTLLSSEAVVVKDLRTEERFQGPPLLHQHGVVSGMSVVIYSGDGPFGVLGAHTKEQRAFSEDDINFLQAVANVLAAAIERVEAEEKLREVREAERSRLARDLHDEALQALTWALVETGLVQQMSEDPTLNQRLERVGEALKRVGQGMHGAIYDLRLEGEAREQTLVEMLELLVEVSRRGSPDCEIDLSVGEGFSPTLSVTKQVELLRILREALTNALRHSGATCVHIAVGTSEGKLWAEVEDDGRGFDPTKTSAAGMGIRGMRERSRALGGDFKISSKPGEGTKVRFELNLEKDREEPEEEVRVLLVEDHASVRQAMASLFEREQGFRVVGQAGSLSEARKMLDGVDVAVVDLGLPDGYGGELIKELRARNPQAQALVLSAMLDRAEIARVVESGAAGVLHKSVEMDEVVEAVRRLRAGETLLPLEEVVELLRFAGSRREEEYEARQTIARLTSREKEVLQALTEGLDSREIAERLHISVKTEANHMTSILNKLGMHSRLQALVFAIRHGVVEIH
jgi:PAS domain S-box-containing protein